MQRLLLALALALLLGCRACRDQSQHGDEGRARRASGYRPGEGAGDPRLPEVRTARSSPSRRLKDVKGIGAKRFEKLKGEFTVGGTVGEGGSAQSADKPARSTAAGGEGRGDLPRSVIAATGGKP